MDEATDTYLLADRSNAAIDVFKASTGAFIKFLQPTDPFAGAISTPSNSAGPNGVILITGKLLPPGPGCIVACNPVFHTGKPVSVVWGTDSPTSGTTGTSKMKLMDLVSGTSLGSLNTGGVRRADELCFVTLPSGAPDPQHPYVMVANDDPLDNFITIWRWDNFSFVQKMKLDGTDPYAVKFNTADGTKKNAAVGIEQCKFNPRNKSFYLAIPTTQSNAIATGTVTAGSGYTPGTYSNVPLACASAGPPPSCTGTGATANIVVTGGGGSITTLGKVTGGTGYITTIYTNVPLTDVTGTGTGATADITVAAGGVTVVRLVSGGSGYNIGDTLSATATSIGGTGSGFQISVATTSSGAITSFGAPTPGSGYTTSTATTATYNNVPLTNTPPSSNLGSGAVGNITVTAGVVTALGAVTPGSGYEVGTYNAVPLTDTTTPTATGATANITVANGAIATLNTGGLVGGSGCTTPGTYNGVALTDGTTATATGATANIVVTGTAVTSVTLVNKGSGYNAGDILSAAAASIGGGCTGFFIPVATVLPNGAVSAVTLVSGGVGYVSADSLTAAISPGGTGFAVAVTTATGVVTAVTLAKPGVNYVTGDTLTASNTFDNGNGSGFKVAVSALGGTVTTVTIVNGGNGYTVGDTLSTANTNIGGTGSGFKFTVLTVIVSPTHADGFVLKISLPVQSTPTSIPSTAAQHAQVVAAYEIFPGSTGCGVTDVGGGPAGLSIGPSLNGTNTNGLIALGCGAGGGNSLVIDDNGTTMLPVSLPAGTDETWYDPASNHFFFAQSGTAPGSGFLGVVDANQYPPRSYIQEDGDNTTGPPATDPTVATATGSHSVAVLPGTCNLPNPNPTRLSRVFVPIRSTLSKPNNGSTICSSALGGFTPTPAAPQWPAGTTQAPTALDYDQWGCIVVLTADAAICTSTGHANPSP